MNRNCIGLFGTCGKSKWRDGFISAYKARGIEFFNPQVVDWKPEFAEAEAEHLANDQIILFPITDETYALGSLAETGFSMLNAIKLDDRRDFIIMIDPILEQELMDKNFETAQESIRIRQIVKQHLKKLGFENLFVVNTLEEMLEVSITLWMSHQIRNKVRGFSIQKT